MYDNNNINIRDKCITSSELIIKNLTNNTNNNNNNNNEILDISISSPNYPNINKNEKLRLIVDINNNNNNENVNNYNFEWIELNNLLSSEYILNNKINNENFGLNYLILNENILEEGINYIFQVIVNNNDNTQYALSSIQIYVNSQPKIVDNSFSIIPSDICNNNIKYYSSYLDIFSNFYDISIESNGDNFPLYYKFSFKHNNDNNINWLFDSYISQNSFIDGMLVLCVCMQPFYEFCVCCVCNFLGVILPIGEYYIQAEVIDSQGASIS